MVQNTKKTYFTNDKKNLNTKRWLNKSFKTLIKLVIIKLNFNKLNFNNFDTFLRAN